MSNRRKSGAEAAFTEEEAAAWQYLDDFVHGEMTAQNLGEAKQAHDVIGKWLADLEG